MSLSEHIINDNDDPAEAWDPDYSVSCALPDLRPIAFVALGVCGVVVTIAALALWAVRKLRTW